MIFTPPRILLPPSLLVNSFYFESYICTYDHCTIMPFAITLISVLIISDFRGGLSPPSQVKVWSEPYYIFLHKPDVIFTTHTHTYSMCYNYRPTKVSLQSIFPRIFFRPGLCTPDHCNFDTPIFFSCRKGNWKNKKDSHIVAIRGSIQD